MSTPVLLLKIIVWTAVMAALLFVPAGTLNWPAGWVCVAEFFVGSVVVSLWLAKHDPALLVERYSAPFQRPQRSWDRVFLSLMMLGWVAWMAIMALDVVRFGVSHMPLWLQVVGAFGPPVGMYLGYRTFRENSFAAPVVKIQRERGQTVITTGPYSLVRHPMYAGALFFIIGTPLLLGSWWGLAIAPLFILLIAVRAVLEERALCDGLEGYADYMRRVRYRLIPMIW
jgi:protein-S-isoprenylcysteine O-methyltransferase Ste14